MIAAHVICGRRCVFLGEVVAQAFLARSEAVPPVCTWQSAWVHTAAVPHTLHYAVIPHPSGLNRWYNDPENVGLARGVLRVAAYPTDGPLP